MLPVIVQPQPSIRLAAAAAVAAAALGLATLAAPPAPCAVDEVATFSEPGLRLPRFLPDGRLITTHRAYIDSFVTVRDGRGTPTLTLDDGAGTIHGVAFDRPGERLVVAGEVHLHVWDVRSGARLLARIEETREVIFSPSGQQLLELSRSGSVWLLDAGSGEIEHVLAARRVEAVAYTPDGAHVVTGDADGVVAVWDARGGLERVLGRHTGAVLGIDVSADGRRVLGRGADHAVRLWDRETGELLVSIAHPIDEGPIVHAELFGEDVLTQTRAGAVRVLDPRRGSPIRGCTPGLPILTTEIFRGGTRFVAGRDPGGTVELWDAATCARIARFGARDSEALEAAFSPDGATLVTTHAGGVGRIWRLR